MSIDKSDLALLDKEEIVLILQVQPAKVVYKQNYDEDDEGGHIWLGGDDVIHHKQVMAQILHARGLEWIRIERLSDIDE